MREAAGGGGVPVPTTQRQPAAEQPLCDVRLVCECERPHVRASNGQRNACMHVMALEAMRYPKQKKQRQPRPAESEYKYEEAVAAVAEAACGVLVCTRPVCPEVQLAWCLVARQ